MKTKEQLKYDQKLKKKANSKSAKVSASRKRNAKERARNARLEQQRLWADIDARREAMKQKENS